MGPTGNASPRRSANPPQTLTHKDKPQEQANSREGSPVQKENAPVTKQDKSPVSSDSDSRYFGAENHLGNYYFDGPKLPEEPKKSSVIKEQELSSSNREQMSSWWHW